MKVLIRNTALNGQPLEEDGEVFTGVTVTDVVYAMKGSTLFSDQRDLEDYIDMVLRNAKMLAGVELAVRGDTPEEKAAAALRMVVERVNEALHGVPEETRDPLPDGSTRYSRPLPGAARMYPETDVPPVAISKERLRRIRENLPELPEDIIRRLVSQYGINEQQAAQLVREGNEEFFERIAADLGLTSIVATVLTSMLPEMEREGCEISLLSEKKIYESLRRLSEGRFAKEALPELLRALCSHKDVDEAINELGLGVVEPGEAEAIIRQLALERKDFVIERGMGAVGPLMGPVMEKLRGKVDGKEASRLLQSIVREIVEGE